MYIEETKRILELFRSMIKPDVAAIKELHEISRKMLQTLLTEDERENQRREITTLMDEKMVPLTLVRWFLNVCSYTFLQKGGKS